MLNCLKILLCCFRSDHFTTLLNIFLRFNFSELENGASSSNRAGEGASGGDQRDDGTSHSVKLEEGDSGSIVYYVGDKKDGKHQHFPWGMLVEKENVSGGKDEDDYQICYAVILDQVFAGYSNRIPTPD